MSRQRRTLLALPPDIHTLPSAEALPIIAEATGGRALVSFSLGKDSTASVLAMRPHFPKLELFYLYLAPGLRMVEEALTYYERLWGRHIHRLPSPLLHRALTVGLFQRPDTAALAARWEPATYRFDHVAKMLRGDLGWPERVPTAIGLRMADSYFRRGVLKRTGIYARSRNVIYPVFDWSHADVERALVAHQTYLAPEYAIMGRSFDGLYHHFIRPIMDHYPDDFARLEVFYPCLRAEIARYQFRARRTGEAA